jgi:membrane fusion protein, copper/silver efflux system
VATQGSFLIDAENRLNPKAAGKQGASPRRGGETPRSAAAPAAAAHRH